MKHRLSRITPCILLSIGLGAGLASAQTPPGRVAPSSSFSGAQKPIPIKSAPADAKRPQYYLPGLAPDLGKNLTVILPGNPAPLFVAAKGVTPNSSGRSTGPLNAPGFVELGAYDR